ncbi:MAG: hypothetical protein U0Q15_08290 [Kineosporiaceae bacterium]
MTTPSEARAALAEIVEVRRRAAARLHVPAWYWAGLAGGWVLLGALAETSHAWLTAAATLAFGAGQAAVAARVVDGRAGTPGIKLRRSATTTGLARHVLLGLVALTVLTTAAALALDADGAHHPAFASGVIGALVVALGGPLLVALTRERAARAVTSAPGQAPDGGRA